MGLDDRWAVGRCPAAVRLLCSAALQVHFPDQQSQPHAGACWKCRLSASTRSSWVRIFGGGPCMQYFYKPSRWIPCEAVRPLPPRNSNLSHLFIKSYLSFQAPSGVLRGSDEGSLGSCSSQNVPDVTSEAIVVAAAAASEDPLQEETCGERVMGPAWLHL